jgi:glycerol-3-phosphate dehydrogenase
VVGTAVNAVQLGARILTKTRPTAAQRVDSKWQARLLDRRGQGEVQLRARALVNAAGPWADQVLATTKTCATGGTKRQERAILVKGSHIDVPRLHYGDFAYILQHTERRVIFVIPYVR